MGVRHIGVTLLFDCAIFGAHDGYALVGVEFWPSNTHLRIHMIVLNVMCHYIK